MAADVAELRRSGVVAGRRALLERPSTLFALLVDADARDGGRRCWTYFRHALVIAHTVASLDVHTSQAELDAIARYRAVLIARIEAAGVPRPEPSFFGIHPGAIEEARRRVAGPDDDRPGPPTWPGAPAGGSATVTAQPDATTGPAAPLPPPRPVEELLAELDALIGLEPVKAEVRLLTNLLVVQRLRRDRGLPTVAPSHHLVFTGNPGTGKTTVARLLAQIFRSLQVVARGQLVETDRSALVAGYVGQTATRTREVITSAVGGVLLIDEAYALARGNENDFGREAIDTLVKMMEDLRDRLVVIAAGYPEEMATFVAANPGLESRFPKTIHFPDYTAGELVAILGHIAEGTRFLLDDGARTAAHAWFDAQPRGRGFGNGRLARNLFEAAVAAQASRLVALDDPTDEQLLTLTADDIAGASR